MKQPTTLSRAGLDEALSNMFSNPTYSSDYLFYAHMIGMCAIKLEEMDAPAAISFNIDHYRLHINPTKFDKYSIPQRLGVLKHEMLHILGNHVSRLETRSMLPWNYATDCAINQMINRDHLIRVTQQELDEAKASGATLDPTVKAGDINCIIPENYPARKGIKVTEGLTAEHYYDMLEFKDDDNTCPNCGGSCNQDSDGEDGDGDGQSQGNGDGSCSCGAGSPDTVDDHSKWQESKGDAELQKDITKNMVEKSINSTQKSRGNLPGNISEILQLFTRKREVDWKKVLRGITGNKRTTSRRTIMRSDRRFPQREDLRGKTKNRMFNLLLVSDVSGSVSDQALTELWGEVIHICKTTNSDVDLIQVDAQAYKPEKLTASSKVMTRKACGGTILNPALDTAKEHNINYQAIVVTTDAYLSKDDVNQFAKTGKKVIWLIEKSGADPMPEMNEGRMMAFKLKK